MMRFVPLSRVLLALAVIGSVSACAQRSYCAGEHAYLEADSVRSLEDVDGLQVPRSSGALVIPPEELSGPAYAEAYEDSRGRTQYRCLDMPPRLRGTGG